MTDYKKAFLWPLLFKACLKTFLLSCCYNNTDISVKENRLYIAFYVNPIYNENKYKCEV